MDKYMREILINFYKYNLDMTKPSCIKVSEFLMKTYTTQRPYRAGMHMHRELLIKYLKEQGYINGMYPFLDSVNQTKFIGKRFWLYMFSAITIATMMRKQFINWAIKELENGGTVK